MENNQAALTRPDPEIVLFNSSAELSLRLAIILVSVAPQGADVQRLVSYDYLLTHSGDIEGGPRSLHPSVPNRGSEWLVKRGRIQRGLDLLISRELISRQFYGGIQYAANELTPKFVELLKSSYAEGLIKRGYWLHRHFGEFSDAALETYMTARIGRWGAEFEDSSEIQDFEIE